MCLNKKRKNSIQDYHTLCPYPTLRWEKLSESPVELDDSSDYIEEHRGKALEVGSWQVKRATWKIRLESPKHW